MVWMVPILRARTGVFRFALFVDLPLRSASALLGAYCTRAPRRNFSRHVTLRLDLLLKRSSTQYLRMNTGRAAFYCDFGVFASGAVVGKLC